MSSPDRRPSVPGPLHRAAGPFRIALTAALTAAGAASAALHPGVQPWGSGEAAPMAAPAAHPGTAAERPSVDGAPLADPAAVKGAKRRSAGAEADVPADRPSETVEEPASGPRPVRPADYGRFESLGFSRALSPDGRWLAYGVRRVDGDSELRLRMLATEETEVIEHGGRPSFSKDGRWLLYDIGVSADEADRLRAARKPIPQKLGLRSLVDGETTEFEGVVSGTFSEDSAFLVFRRQMPDGKEEGGTDIIVHELDGGVRTSFGNVDAFAWNDAGTHLAMVVHTDDDAGNGIHLFDPSTGTLKVLDSAEAKYTGLTWHEEASHLAVMRELPHEEKEDVGHDVLAWTDLGGERPARRWRLEATEHADVPAELRIVTYSGLQWTEDGDGLLFGLQPWENKPEALAGEDAEGTSRKEGDEDGEGERDDGAGDGEGEPQPGGDGAPRGRRSGGDSKDEVGKTLRETIEEPSNVEVWHVRDIDIIPRQKITASRDRREDVRGIWWLGDDTFVQLENEITEDVMTLDGADRMIGFDETPHEELQRFGPTLRDVYVINARTGERERVLEAVKYAYAPSPDGRWMLFVRDDQVWSLELATGEQRNLTAGVGPAFINQEMSTLTDEKPPYGVAGWTEDGGTVVLQDRYDLWAFRADGSGHERLTRGAKDRIRHRRVILDRERDEHIDPDAEMYLSLYGDVTKESGYARMRMGERPEILVWEDARVSGLMTAEDASVYAYTRERYDDPPDLFVGGAELEDARQVSAINPFIDEYAWGRAELVDYENARGEAMQGALFYPADYEPGKQYPMIVYIYELRSQVLHNFQVPSETSAYNTSVFSAEGYFVFQPDITYRPQNPGLSAVECIIPAVETVLETGMIDQERVGLVGHSWGAYQTAFVVTQTDLFAAGVAGAPLTNMISMSMSIYWNSGQTDAWIFHESQGRMDRPFWEDLDTYVANSPIFHIADLTTPLLVAFGDDDGAVDFNQGVEMYNAARLAQVPFVMLVYPGENHGLRREENRVDYHYRILEWFGHYLQGDDAEPWITEGLPWLERQEQIEEQGSARRGGGRRGP